MMLAATLISSSVALVASTSFADSFIRKEEVPISGWTKLRNRVDFYPTNDNDEVVHTSHRGLGGDTSSVYKTQFVDGSETYYDEFAQAWRYLGFYIDCNAEEEAEEQNYRDLEEGYNVDYNGFYDYDTTCVRYLLWAAYIDPNYEGGGYAEYRQFNRSTKKYEPSECSGGERCAKMDCHERTSNFKLLGIFKEAYVGNWLSELVNHQGTCIWSSQVKSNLYKIDEPEAWPIGCTQSNTYDKNGYPLYFHTKPLNGGRISIGLYTDSQCSQDYSGYLTVEEIVGAMYNEGGRQLNAQGTQQLYESLDDWNEALDDFKVCRPCKSATYGEKCLDVEGNYGTNQCVQFAQNTKMSTATLNDAALASEQGTIVSISIAGNRFGHGGYSSGPGIVSLTFFAVLLTIFILGLFAYQLAKRNVAQATKSNMKSPLVKNQKGVLS